VFGSVAFGEMHDASDIDLAHCDARWNAILTHHGRRFPKIHNLDSSIHRRELMIL